MIVPISRWAPQTIFFFSPGTIPQTVDDGNAHNVLAESGESRTRLGLVQVWSDFSTIGLKNSNWKKKSDTLESMGCYDCANRSDRILRCILSTKFPRILQIFNQPLTIIVIFKLNFICIGEIIKILLSNVLCEKLPNNKYFKNNF